MSEILSFSGLAIGYGRPPKECSLARGLEGHLRAGELVGLLGPNGAGKSTLLKTLSGLEPPLAGSIHCLGRSLRELSPVARARDLAVVLTSRPDTAFMTVRDLVSLGRIPHGAMGSDDDARAVDQALASTGLGPLASRFVGEISDGERQKACIARGLAQEPRCLILDEPTAFLDAARRVEIALLMRRLARKGLGVLMSTHDIELALRLCDRIWILEVGGGFVCASPSEPSLRSRVQGMFGNLDPEVVSAMVGRWG